MLSSDIVVKWDWLTAGFDRPGPPLALGARFLPTRYRI